MTDCKWVFLREHFQRHIKSLGDYEDVTSGSTKELLNDDEFCGILVWRGIARKVGYVTLYLKDVIELLWAPVDFLGKDEIIFCHEHENELIIAQFRGMAFECIRKCYKEAKTENIGSLDSKKVWKEKSDGAAKSFAGFAQLFSNKTMTMLRLGVSSVFCTCFLPNCVSRNRVMVYRNGHTLVVLLPVCCTLKELEKA